MSRRLEVPLDEDLAELPLEVLSGESLGVSTVLAVAGDGSELSVTWDEIACSVTVRWRSEGTDRLVMTRETATQVTIRDERDHTDFRIRSESDELTGELVIGVGSVVTVSDALLRR